LEIIFVIPPVDRHPICLSSILVPGASGATPGSSASMRSPTLGGRSGQAGMMGSPALGGMAGELDLRPQMEMTRPTAGGNSLSPPVGPAGVVMTFFCLFHSCSPFLCRAAFMNFINNNTSQSQNQCFALLYAVANLPSVNKHIQFYLSRKDITDGQKVESIANLLRALTPQAPNANAATSASAPPPAPMGNLLSGQQLPLPSAAPNGLMGQNRPTAMLHMTAS
jgi:hypothetical protein